MRQPRASQSLGASSNHFVLQHQTTHSQAYARVGPDH